MKIITLFIGGLLAFIYIPIFLNIFREFQQHIDMLNSIATIFLGLLFVFAIKAMQSFFIQSIEFDFQSGKLGLNKTFGKLVLYKQDVVEWGIRNVGGYPQHVISRFFECRLNDGRVINYPLFNMQDNPKIKSLFVEFFNSEPKQYDTEYAWVEGNDLILLKYSLVFLLL